MKFLKTIWLTGLSGSGKSTLANAISKYFDKLYVKSIILDGDVLRQGLNADLGFSRADRKENVRRIAEISKLLLKLNIVPIVAVICPFEEDRLSIRKILGNENLLEIYVKCPIEICAKRDPKGLYQKAYNKEIEEFTGVTAPFEEPMISDIVINTHELSVTESLELFIDYVMNNN